MGVLAPNKRSDKVKKPKAAPKKKKAHTVKKKAAPHKAAAPQKRKAAPRKKAAAHKVIKQAAPKYRKPPIDAAATAAVKNAKNEVDPEIVGEDKMYKFPPPQPYHESQIEKMSEEDKGPPG